MERCSCLICDVGTVKEFDGFQKLKRVTSDAKLFPSGGRLGICDTCSTVQKFADKKWLSEIDEIYKDYSTFSVEGFIDQQVYDDRHQKLRPRCELILERLSEVVDIKKGSKWLDYGCGRGAMLNAASKFDPQLFGYDLNDSHKEYLGSIENFQKLYSDLDKIPDGTFDFISMIHSIEHFVDPIKDLKAAVRKLKPDGYLFIQVNDTRLNPFEVLVADHLTHFEPATLSNMVKKQGVVIELLHNDFIGKEISLLASKKGQPVITDPEPATHGEVNIQLQIDWLKSLSDLANDLTERPKFGLFGSSIAATWLYGETSGKISYFVDEDESRIGEKHLGLPIVSPQSLGSDNVVLLGLIPSVADSISLKFTDLEVNLVDPPPIPKIQRPLKPFFSCFVWGKDYIDVFCDLVLPMQLSEDNIPAVVQKTDAKYVIFTKSEDFKYLSEKTRIQYLASLLPFEILIFEETSSEKDKYGLISKLQCISMNLAKSEGYDCLFPFYADVLCSNGSINFSYDRLSEGSGAVVSLGPQTILEQIKPRLITEKNQKGPNVLQVSSRDLVKHTFDSLHPFHAPSFWEKENFTTVPSMMFWRAPNNGVIAHGFHLHPIAFLIPESPNLLRPFHGTIDEHFMPTMFSSSEEVFICEDSDDVFMCSVESLDELLIRGKSVSGSPTVAKVARYAERHTFALQREMVTVPLLIHENDIDHSEWAPYLQKSRDIISRILTRLSIPDSVLELEDKEAFDGRAYHKTQLELIEAKQLSLEDEFNISIYSRQENKGTSSNNQSLLNDVIQKIDDKMLDEAFGKQDFVEDKTRNIQDPTEVLAVRDAIKNLEEKKLKESFGKAAATAKASATALLAKEFLDEISKKTVGVAERNAAREAVKNLQAKLLKDAFTKAEINTIPSVNLNAGPTLKERMANLYSGHYSMSLLFLHLLFRLMLFVVPITFRTRLRQTLSEDGTPLGKNFISLSIGKFISPIIKFTRNHHREHQELFRFRVNSLLRHFIKRMARIS